MTAETSTPESTTPAAHPAEIIIHGTWNARDVGGRAVPAGSAVPLRTGVLLRTASLAGLDAEGAAQLAALGVTKVLDLRGDHEVSRDGADVVPPGVEVLRLPFGVQEKPEGADPESGGADMMSLLTRLVGSGEPAAIGEAIMKHVYEGFITDPAAHSAVATSLRTIAENDRATVVHCAAGKDRTGWVVALVQAICGVPEADILVEYLLSSNAAAQLAASMPAVPGIDPAVWDAVLTVRPEYLAAARATLEETYGTLDGYLDAIGVDAQARQALRVRFGLVS